MSKPAILPIGDSEISAALSPFGLVLSSDQLGQIRAYISILLKWNRLLSLTAITDPIEIVSRHFGESMFASAVLPLGSGRLADVGTGAGFPGLALKVLYPTLLVSLIESNQKKCAFLSEVIRALNLTGVGVFPMRFEEMRTEAGLFDFVAARALGGFPGLFNWAKLVLARRGHLVLWTGLEDTTRIAGTNGWIWNPAVRIPESQRRFLLTGRPSP